MIIILFVASVCVSVYGCVVRLHPGTIYKRQQAHSQGGGVRGGSDEPPCKIYF